MNGKKATGNEKLAVGDSVKLFLADETIAKFSNIHAVHTNVTLDIIYEDENVLLINKPVGMLSQKAAADDESLVEHIISYMLETRQLTEEELKKIQTVCLQPFGPQYEWTGGSREKSCRAAGDGNTF